MTDLILLTNSDYLNEIIKVLSRRSSKKYIIVTSRERVKSLIILFKKRLSNIDIYVLENKPLVEERIVKLIVDTKPDTIVDCDSSNELFYLKNFIKNMFVNKINCIDYLSTENA